MKTKEDNSGGEDLSVAGPGSPISMAKLVKQLDLGLNQENDKKTRLSILIDNSNSGFELDEPSLAPITVENRKIQAEWFVDNIFLKQEKRDIPAYLFRYLLYLFDDKHTFGETKYTDDDFRKGVQSGKINVDTDEDFCMVYNMIKYSASNKAVQQAIGLIQLVAGSLRVAVKQNTGIRFYIEHPETHMHPKQERILVSLLHMLSDEYGPKEMKTTIKTEED